jgi:hypothetical protein
MRIIADIDQIIFMLIGLVLLALLLCLLTEQVRGKKK